MTESELRLRQAVRALMIDHHDRVLMVKLDLSFTDWVGWVLPGGGIEEGEEIEAALRRELLEETGLANPFIGPVVARHRHIGPGIAQGYDGQEELIHLVPCHDFELKPTMSEQELRDENIVDMQWFTVQQLRDCPDSLAPRPLVELVERVLEFGGSIEPLQIEITNP